MNRFTFRAALLATATAGLLGACALDVGISKSTDVSGAVAIAMSATYPLLTIALVLKYTTERTKLIPLAGALVGIGGVVLLSLG